MGLNWDEFAKQVQGGISNATNTFANLTVADIQRKKEMADRLEIMKQNQRYQEQNQAAEFFNRQTLLRMEDGLTRSRIVFDTKIKEDSAKHMENWNQEMDAYLNDKDWGAMLAFNNLYGKMAPDGKTRLADAQWDLVQNLRKGTPPPPNAKALLDTFTPIARGKVESMIQKALEFQSSMLDRKAYREYMQGLHEQITDKPWTIHDADKALQDALQKSGEFMDRASAIEKEIGYQDSTRIASEYTNPQTGEIDTELFKQKDLESYTTWSGYQARLGPLKEMLGIQQGIVEDITSLRNVLKAKGAPPPEPTDADKQAYFDFTTPKENEPKTGEKPNKSTGQKISSAGKAVSDFFGSDTGGLRQGVHAIFGTSKLSQREMRKYQAQAAATYGIDPSKVVVINNAIDYERLLKGKASLPIGVYIYDANHGDLVRSIGNGMVVRINNVNK